MTTEHKFAKQSQFPTRLSRAGVGGTAWSTQRGRLQGARRPVTSCGRRRSLDADGWKTYLTSDDPPRTATYLSEGGRPSGRLTLARPGWESRTESTTGGKNRSGARAGFGETDGRRPARAFHDEGSQIVKDVERTTWRRSAPPARRAPPRPSRSRRRPCRARASARTRPRAGRYKRWFFAPRPGHGKNRPPNAPPSLSSPRPPARAARASYRDRVAQVRPLRPDHLNRTALQAALAPERRPGSERYPALAALG
jgi:hypothetical protein